MADGQAEELEKHSISVEIVDPRTLRPMDEQTIVGSVRKTHRAVAVESGAAFASLDSEIVSFIAEQAFDDLDAPVERVTGADAPIPYAKNLAPLKAPTPETIVAAVVACAALHQFLDERLRDVRGDAQRAVSQWTAFTEHWF